MPASETQDLRRLRVLSMLYWGGVGLAPLTILILMFGQGTGSLRVAVIFAVFSVVGIGVSITMRRDTDLIRIELQHLMIDQVEQVRAEVRNDVTIASRNTYHALSDKLAVLAETVETLRYQLEEALQAAPVVPVAAPQPVVPPAAAAAVPPGPSGVVHHTETVHVTRRTTVDADGGRGTVYGSRAAASADRDEDRYGGADAEPRSRARSRPPEEDRRERRRRESDEDDRYGDSRHERRRDDRDDRDRDDRDPDDLERGRARGERDRRTRDRGERDRGERDRGERDRPGRDARPGRDGDRYDRDDRHERDGDRHDRDRLDRDGDRWDSAAGDRWASLRDDDRGRELRIGERRSTVRSDDRGREFRVEDRWAALRREEPRDARHDDEEADWEATFRSLRRSQPALPSSPGESPRAYVDDYREREPDRERAPRPRSPHPSEYDDWR